MTALLVVSAGVSLLASQRAGAAADQAIVLGEAQRLHVLDDMYHDETMGLVERASSAVREGDPADLDVVRGELAGVQTELRRSAEQVSALELPDSARAALTEAAQVMSTYVALASSSVEAMAADPADRTELLQEFRAEWQQVADQMDAVTDVVVSDVAAAQSASSSARAHAAWILLGAAAATLALLVGAVVRLSRSITRSLNTVGDVATAISEGDLQARTSGLSDDEIGLLGSRIDQMADSLEAMMHRLEVDRARSAFGAEVNSALEMVDSELDVHTTIGRAMLNISTDAKMELLLADSSEAHLERACAHPVNGAPGCGVESPFGCVAVRRGSTVVFDDSSSLDVCPRLVDRADGPCSAVCVPVAFMGRALGVLHVTAEQGQPPDATTIERLGTLATGAATRIGTVRAFDQSQRRAATDHLTGLMNRRSFEDAVKDLRREGRSVAIAMIDIDHFKWLNDAHGHETGDRALQMFSSVLRDSFRDDDLVARWGGEEFAVGFPGLDARQAAESLERVRQALALECAASPLPDVTASYGVSDSGIADSLDGMIRSADQALYAAKDGGRDRVIVASGPADSSFRPGHDADAAIDREYLSSSS